MYSVEGVAMAITQVIAPLEGGIYYSQVYVPGFVFRGYGSH
jgi:hypothetical protein